MSKMKSHHEDIKAGLAAQGENAPYFKKMLMVKDQKKADKLTREHLNVKAEAAVGEERSSLKDETADLEKTDKRQEADIAKLRKQLSKTDDTVTEYDKRAEEIPDAQQRDIRKWLDYGLAAGCFTGGGIAILASMLAMNVLVRSAGIIAIIENPLYAWAYCVPLGLCAIALEFFKRTLKTHEAKRLYTKKSFMEPVRRS